MSELTCYGGKCLEADTGKYVFGETPTEKQIRDALDVLKCERLARWQTMMTEQEKSEIEQAHNLCIFLLSEHLNK